MTAKGYLIQSTWRSISNDWCLWQLYGGIGFNYCSALGSSWQARVTSKVYLEDINLNFGEKKKNTFDFLSI